MKKLLLLLLVPIALTAQNFWTEVAPFPADAQYYVHDISIVDENVIWVSGLANNGPDFYKWGRSTDGGVTWQSGNISVGTGIPNFGIGSFHAVSADRAYVSVFPNSADELSGVWVTTDGGATWTQQLGQNWTNMFPNFVHFFNANDGIVVCDPVNGFFEIYITNDAGMNWTMIPSVNIPAPLASEYGYTRCFDDADGNFWFGTNKGRLYYTNATNTEMTWQVSQSPVSDFGSATISGEFAFKNQNEGLFATTDFTFWRTTNSGANWTQEFPTGVPRNYTLTHVTGTNSYFASGEDIEMIGRGSSYSTDGGYNWINLDEDEDPVYPEQVAFASGTVGFCAGRYLSDIFGPKRFFRMTDPLNRLLKTSTFNGKPSLTVTPNPTQDWVKISGENIIFVQICDLSGKVIVTQNGNALDEVIIDLSGFQTGVYLANIRTESGGINAVKIVRQ